MQTKLSKLERYLLKQTDQFVLRSSKASKKPEQKTATSRPDFMSQAKFNQLLRSELEAKSVEDRERDRLKSLK